VKPSDLKRSLQSRNVPPTAAKIAAQIVPPEAADWLRKVGIIQEHVPEPLRSQLLGQQMSPHNMRAAGLILPDEADASPTDTLDQADRPVVHPQDNKPTNWRDKPSGENIKAAMLDIAKEYPDGAHPPETEIWSKLKDRLGPSVSRNQARSAYEYAPHLKGQRGRHWTK
jgi:hypothetical protein